LLFRCLFGGKGFQLIRYEVRLTDGSIEYIDADGYYEPLPFTWGVDSDYWFFYRDTVVRKNGFLGWLLGCIERIERQKIRKFHRDDVECVQEYKRGEC